MDGNGRWAKSRGLSRIKGHEAGAQAVRECVEGCGELKVEYLTLYAFSAENWQRPRAEIIALMRLLEKFLKEKTPELLEKNVRLQAIGRLTDLPRSAQEQLHKSIEQTSGNTGLILVLALSYGGRLEIIDGIKSLLRAIELGHIDRAMIDVDDVQQTSLHALLSRSRPSYPHVRRNAALEFSAVANFLHGDVHHAKAVA